MKIIDGRIQHKRDTADNWENSNPILLNGEIIIVDIDIDGGNRTIQKIKIGDGSSHYIDLPFAIDYSQMLMDDLDALELKRDQTNLGLNFVNMCGTYAYVNNLYVASNSLSTGLGRIELDNNPSIIKDVEFPQLPELEGYTRQRIIYLDQNLAGYVYAIATRTKSASGGNYSTNYHMYVSKIC